MTNLIELDPIDFAFALALIGIAVGLSSWQRLGLEGQLATAAVRSLLQLVGIGYILAFVFALDNLWAVLAVIAIMLTVAAIVTRNRISQKLSRLFLIAWGAIFASSALTLSYAILLVIQPPTWYEPQYLIPLAGMVIGNTVNGATIAGERLVSTIDRSRTEIETHLSLGATPQQAVASYRKAAIRAGLIPNLNQMAIVGMVTLPGMLTGQLLSGVDPLNAVYYQILILFMQALANLLATSLVTQGVYRQFFNQNSQLVTIKN